MTDSGTFSAMSPFTLHWHPSRQWSLISLRLKCGRSESSISPPPSTTCTLHCPQLALPPQAEGRKTPFSFSVAMTELPWSTVSCLSPLMVIVTFPLGLRYFFATSRRITSTRMVIRNTAILVVMNCPMIVRLDFKT